MCSDSARDTGFASHQPTATPAIRVRGLSKHYRLYDSTVARLKEQLWRPLNKALGRTLPPYYRPFTALSGNDMEVWPGQTMGIVGRNGSCKSTLLQLISGIGGRVCFDPEPCLDYRQHGANQIGMRTGWSSLWPRVKRLWQGQHRHHLENHLQALEARQQRLDPCCRQQLERFQQARYKRALPRLFGYWRAGVYRQTWLGQCGLYIAAILNKS